MRLSVYKQTTALNLPTLCSQKVWQSRHYLKRSWRSSASGISGSRSLLPVITGRSNVLTEKIMSISMRHTNSIPLKISKSNLPFGRGNTTISPCVLCIGRLPFRSFLLFPMCNASLTNPQTRVDVVSECVVVPW